MLDWSRQPDCVRTFVLVCVAVEALATFDLLFGAGFGVRNTLVAFGGFWPGLFHGQSGFLPGQIVYMFASSAFIHGGLAHLFMNMIGLLWLGPIIVQRLGEPAFWPLAGLSALGAGGLFALMASTGTPMVGASGVLFGFLGAIAAWTVLDLRARNESLGHLTGHAAAFLALNIALVVLSNGNIAWQAHLGGFVSGVLCGLWTWQGRRTR